MLNPEKKQEANKVKFAMANFFEEIAASSTLTDLHKDFQDIFEVLMLSDEADDVDFRNRAVLILQFTKAFDKYISNIPWQTLDKVARKMKDDVSLKCYLAMHYRIIYPKGIRLTLKYRTFKEAMEMVWLSDIANHTEPLKMVFTTTGKMMYMDKNAHMAFLRGDIKMQELIELTEIDELYRNRVEVVSNERITVDAGSLWKLRKQTLILIDDDKEVTHKLNLDIFEIAEPNL